jgi:hypothetical protein
MHSASFIPIFILAISLNGILSSGIDLVELWSGADDKLPRSRRRDPILHDISNKLSRELEEHGMKEEHTRRLSSKFLLGLYQRLNLGLDMWQATGHGWIHDGKIQGDTIRSIPTKSRFIFPLSIVQGVEK